MRRGPFLRPRPRLRSCEEAAGTFKPVGAPDAPCPGSPAGTLAIVRSPGAKCLGGTRSRVLVCTPLLDPKIADCYLYPQQGRDEPGKRCLDEKETSHLSCCFDRLRGQWRSPELARGAWVSSLYPQIENPDGKSAQPPVPLPKHRHRSPPRKHCSCHWRVTLMILFDPEKTLR